MQNRLTFPKPESHSREQHGVNLSCLRSVAGVAARQSQRSTEGAVDCRCQDAFRCTAPPVQPKAARESFTVPKHHMLLSWFDKDIRGKSKVLGAYAPSRSAQKSDVVMALSCQPSCSQKAERTQTSGYNPSPLRSPIMFHSCFKSFNVCPT